MSVEFIGRVKELEKLNALWSLRPANLVVLRGRRRIGKSRLVEEFAKNVNFYKFSGLAPNNETTPQDQRDEFSRQFKEQFNIPSVIKSDDWGTLFYLLAEKVQTDKSVVLLDEISWMAMDDATFLGKLKTAWDDYFKKNPNLILVICGSVSSWIKNHVINNTAFFGRITLDMLLEELPIELCKQFWGQQSENVSAYEKLKLLSVTGGVPRYLELINPNQTAEDNIRRLCFVQDSMLIKEFKQVFVDIFGKRSPIYESIVKHLVTGKKTAEELSQLLSVSLTGTFTSYLDELQQAGFIAKDHTWNLKTGKSSRLSYYRLKDNFLRFYLKYMLQNLEKIKRGHFEDMSMAHLPGWQTILGLQFENLVLNNYKQILHQLSINSEDIMFENPYFQRPTTRQKGVQVDYMVQTRFNTIYLCEIKFHRQPISSKVIDEVKQKVQALSVTKGYSIRPVLIHVNGVSDEVLESQFFASVIDFSELL